MLVGAPRRCYGNGSVHWAIWQDMHVHFSHQQHHMVHLLSIPLQLD